MRKTYPKLLILAFILFYGCKKGGDDPAFSLRTRKSRLAGEWRLESGTAIVAVVNLVKFERYNLSFSFLATRYSLTETGNNNPTSSSGSYVLSLETDKKGNFTFSEQIFSKKITASGNWEFLPKGDSKKNKERVFMKVNNISTGNSSDFHIFNQNTETFVYQIKELRNKKLVLVANAETEEDSDGYYYTYTLEYVFIQ